ncbi:hypothetical protein [Methylobacterium sp. A54F]
MTATGAILFSNADWLVCDEGLEHRGTGYFIERAGLGDRREEGLWVWPLHMAEKRWCTPSLFRDAFLAALECFGIGRDAELSSSFALGFGIRAGQGAATEGFLCLADVLRPRADIRRTVPVPHDRGTRVRAGARA